MAAGVVASSRPVQIMSSRHSGTGSLSWDQSLPAFSAPRECCGGCKPVEHPELIGIDDVPRGFLWATQSVVAQAAARR
jgi:hypothetical protein